MTQISIRTRTGDGRRFRQTVEAEMVGEHLAIVDRPNPTIIDPPWIGLYHVPTGLRVAGVERLVEGLSKKKVRRARAAMRRFAEWMHRVHPDLSTTVLPASTPDGPALTAWRDIEHEALAWTPSWTAPDQQEEARDV